MDLECVGRAWGVCLGILDFRTEFVCFGYIRISEFTELRVCTRLRTRFAYSPRFGFGKGRLLSRFVFPEIFHCV